MGNAIAKKFDLPKDHTATAGHTGLWKIWPGENSKDGSTVSVWAFDKNDLAKRKQNPVSDRAIVDQVYQIMKRDLSLIKESKNCSSIIQCIEVVEESKSVLAFTTERIVCSLADIFNNYENVPSGASNPDFFIYGETFSEMEISRALLNLAEGLQFLHTVQRKLHMGISPESVVITSAGQWKLCGFGFSLSFIQGDQQRLASPYFLKAMSSSVINSVGRLEPDLCYCGPEYTDGGINPPGVRYLTPVADVFSLGLLMYEVFCFNLKYNSIQRSSFRPLIPITNNDVAQHHFALESLKTVDLSFLPPGLAQLLLGMIQLNTQIRITTSDIINNTYFVTGCQAVINLISSMHSKDLGTQSSQMISLQGQLHDFPTRLLTFLVLPLVSSLCVENPALWVYALPLHMFLSQRIPSEKYQYFAAPFIAAGLKVVSPTETMQAFLVHITFITGIFDSDFFQENVVAVFCNALDKQNMYLQSLALEKLSEEGIRSSFEPESLQGKLMPKLCKEACKNPEANVKIQALYILSLFTRMLDKTFIAENVLPSLRYITDNERNPTVSMCVMGNYEALSDTLGPEYIATSILPPIQEMLVDKELNRKQFEVVVDLVKQLLKRLLDKRTQDFDMPAISLGDMISQNAEDPFLPAKTLIEASKRSRARSADEQTLSTSINTRASFSAASNSNKVPPPVPSTPAPNYAPPPPPSHAAPPLPVSSSASVVRGSTPRGSFTAPAPVHRGSMTLNMNSNSSFNSAFATPTLPPDIVGGDNLSAANDTYSAPAVPPPLPPVAPSIPAEIPESKTTNSRTSSINSVSVTSQNMFGLEPTPVSTTPAMKPMGSVEIPTSTSTLPSYNGFSDEVLAAATEAAMSASANSSSASKKKTTSSFSWFSSKSKDKDDPPIYKPPVVPNTASVPSPPTTPGFPSTSTISDLAAGGSSLNGIGYTAPYTAPQTATGGSGFPSSSYSAPYTAPVANMGVPNANAGLSIEEQIRETQAKIAQLSNSNSVNSLNSMGSYNPAPVPAYTPGNTAYQAPVTSGSYPAQPIGGGYNQPYGASPGMAMGQPSGGYGMAGRPQQSFPQNASMYGQQPQMGLQYGAPVGGGYGGGANGTVNNFYSRGAQSQPQAYSANIGNLPASTGYQPPMAAPGVYQQPPQQTHQQNNRNKVDSAFDFLN